MTHPESCAVGSGRPECRLMVDGYSWATAFALVTLLLLIAPAMIRMQRGRNWLLSLAVWLAVAAALALAYRLIGPVLD